MSSYFITGVSRGIGLEFLRQTSSHPANIVIGLVRNKPETEAKIADWKRSNIHILQGDVTDYESLKRAADETAKITGGRLDYIIANAALITKWSAYNSMGELGNDPKRLEEDLLETFKVNTIGNIHLFNLLMPLILKGEKKKVITLSSGMADADLIIKYEIDLGGPYSISKAAMNLAIAKYHAQYAKDGVLFMGICPGSVSTGQWEGATEEQMQRAMGMFEKFKQYAPHFEGEAQPESAARDVLSVIEKSSLANGDGGAYISHLGTKQWL